MPELVDIVREKLGRIWEEYYLTPPLDFQLEKFEAQCVKWITPCGEGIIEATENGYVTYQVYMYYEEKRYMQRDVSEFFQCMVLRDFAVPQASFQKNEETWLVRIEVSKWLEISAVVELVKATQAVSIYQSADTEFVALARGVVGGENPVALIDWVETCGVVFA